MWEGMMVLSWSVLLTDIVPLLSRVTTEFSVFEGCAGYLEYLFGKSYRKSDRACLHWLQKDVQPR